MNQSLYIALIPLLPLVGFVLLGLFGKTIFKKNAGVFATVLLLASTVLSIYTAYEYFIHSNAGSYSSEVPLQYTWLQFSDKLSIDMGILLDPLFRVATLYLESILQDEKLACRFVEIDRYKRDVMMCFVSGQDIGSMLVQMGMARDFRKYSGGHYALEEQTAQEKRYGIWK